jgi:DinB superfamily
MTTKRATNLEELETQFTAVCARASALVDSVDAQLLARRPREGSWSMIECIEHLNMSADPYFPLWESGIAQAGKRSVPDNAPYRMDFWGRLLEWSLEPPPRFRFPTSKPFQPRSLSEIGPVLQGFLDRQQGIIQNLRKSRGLAVDNIKIASPFSQRVYYSVWSSFVVTAAHERRHLWQAEQAAHSLRAV